jgi:methionyl-tRNA formyltransferase
LSGYHPLRVAFAGTPEFALAPLMALHGSSHEIVGVLTQPDRPAGRGRKLAPSVIKEYALTHGLNLAQPVRLRSEADWQPLQEWAPDVLVVVAYGLILPPTVLGLPRFGCLNIHASLLPRWRGAAPIQRAVLAGDPATGVSIMQMDAGLDTGPVWLMKETPIGAEETASELQQRLARLGAEALLQVLAEITTGQSAPQPQPEVGMTYAKKIDKAEALIDWRADGKEIAQKVRAFSGWPVAETHMQGEQWRIHRARYLADFPVRSAVDEHTPGRLCGMWRDERDGEEMLVVGCGQGWLGLIELQRAGKRRMSAHDFVNSLPHAMANTGVLG